MPLGPLSPDLRPDQQQKTVVARNVGPARLSLPLRSLGRQGLQADEWPLPGVGVRAESCSDSCADNRLLPSLLIACLACDSSVCLEPPTGSGLSLSSCLGGAAAAERASLLSALARARGSTRTLDLGGTPCLGCPHNREPLWALGKWKASGSWGSECPRSHSSALWISCSHRTKCSPARSVPHGPAHLQVTFHPFLQPPHLPGHKDTP